MPWIAGGLLALSPEAMNAVGTILSQWGEILPLQCNSAEVALFNPLVSVSALDEDRAKLTRFATSGRIMTVEKYEFRPEQIGGKGAFVVPEVGRVLFLQEGVVGAFRAADLRGTDFVEVWRQ